jgi:hypothetical protein
MATARADHDDRARAMTSPSLETRLSARARLPAGSRETVSESLVGSGNARNAINLRRTCKILLIQGIIERVSRCAWRLASLSVVLVLAACGGSAGESATKHERPERSAVAQQSATTQSTPPATAAPSSSSPTSFVQGTLVAASPDSFSVKMGSGTETFALSAASQICRGGCSATWLALRPGDRIDAGVDLSADPPQTHWVNVNSWSDYAQIDAIDGDRLEVHSTRHPDQPSPEYSVAVDHDTRINPRSDGGAEARGSFPGAHIGQQIYFTGSTQGPDDASVVFATTIYG